MDFLRFRDADLAAFTDAAQTWRGYADGMYALQDRIDSQILAFTRASGWAGAAAEESEGMAAFLKHLCETRGMRADAMADVFEQLNEHLTTMHTDLLTLVDSATAQGLTVRDDGTVIAPGEPPVQPDATGLTSPAAEVAAQYTTAISGLLNQVEQLSSSAIETISDLAPEIPGAVTEHEYNDIRDDAHEHGLAYEISCVEHPPGTPQENEDWWNSLTPAEQDAYILTYPESVGAMDGLPVETRDRANRWNLERDIEVGHDRENAKKLLAAVEGRDHLPPDQRVYLIGYQGPGANGNPDAKVIASIGNPDTATNTGVYVPGTSTNLESSSGPDGLGRALAIKDQADALSYGGSGSNAVVFWLGYDAPDNIPDAANPQYATEGAPALVNFMDGMSASHGDGVPSHTTVIGHSYGSTLVGHAASGDNFLRTDDIVTLGSPGMGVDSAGQLNTAFDHVWAGANWDDPVQNAPGHGPDPTDTSFGANDFQTNTSGHSGYWDPESESLKNQARIMTGQYEFVTWTGRTVVDSLLDPFGIKD